MLIKLLDYTSQFHVFCISLLTFYCILPLGVYYLNTDLFMLLLSKVSLLALVGLVIGFWGGSSLLPVCAFKRIRINSTWFFYTVFFIFFVYLILLLITSDSIPFVFALKNRDPYLIANSRANFLKARQGYEIVFLYVNSILTTSILPYLIIFTFERNYPSRWFALLIPYIYSFIFLEKAFFLKFILPFISYWSHKKYKKHVYLLLVSVPLVIYLNTVLSGFGSAKANFAHEALPSEEKVLPSEEKVLPSEEKVLPSEVELACHNYFSSKYILCANEKGRLGFIFWRIFAVPVFTAADSLHLLSYKYDNQLLLGKTSSAVSLLTHQQNIKFEREVFNFEWGADATGTASANSVYFIEQFVNFGWFGVFLSSLLIGYIYAVLVGTNNQSLASMAIIFSFSLFYGGFFSTLLSGGFLFLFIFTSFFYLE